MTRTTDTAIHILREVTGVAPTGSAADFAVLARRAVELPGVPGWLTAEPLADQGIETALPNLPDLRLPPDETAAWTLRIEAWGPRTVRLLVARPDARVLQEPAAWLGIVTGSPVPAHVTVTTTHDGTVLATDAVRVVVRRRPFEVRIEDVATGRVLLRTAHRLRQVAGFPLAPPVLCADGETTLHLEMGTKEDVLGFGEQFGRLVKNGQHLVLRVEDALGTGTGMTYKPVPVWHSTSGYTGFLNTGATVTADVGHRRPSVLGLTAEDDALDLFVVAGEDPKQRLTDYTALTGRAAVPQAWAFGYWMGRCRYSSAAQMLDVARTMRAHEVPCDVLHLDPDWLVADHLNTDFIWNTGRFGDRREFVEALADQGLRLSVWEVPYLDPASPRYTEAESKGYLATHADGHTVALMRGTPAPDGRPRAVVDLTDPGARAWWQSLHEPFLADGVAVFKTDFGEGLPDDAALADGTPANHAHNLFPLRYNGAVYEAIAAFTDRPSLVWGRSGWAGSQRYPGQWGGDAESTVVGMQATLRGGLSYALSAPGLWSHDIGGFFGPELTPELYVRWTQFGAMSPLMRAHGIRPREPWVFGDAALASCRDWIRLRYSLLPYLWQLAHEAAAHGWPVLRPLALEYPHDPIARVIDDQFLLGRDLLVVPVLDDGPGPVLRRFYVPEDHWHELFTGETFTGPAYHEVNVPLERIPVLVRAGAVIPQVDVRTQDRCVDDLLERPWKLLVAGPDDVAVDLVGFDGSMTRVVITGQTSASEGTQAVIGRITRLPQ
jgi:alpha-D-xyloside xylohydrolase